MHSTFDI